MPSGVAPAELMAADAGPAWKPVRGLGATVTVTPGHGTGSCVARAACVRAEHLFVTGCVRQPVFPAPGQLVVTGEIRLATPLHLYRIPCLIRAIFASGIALVSGIRGHVRTSTGIVLDTLCWLRCLS